MGRMMVVLLLCSFASAADEGARIFAPGIISTGKEFGLSFSPDGKEAYFTRFDAEKKRNHIFRSRLLNGEWQPATMVDLGGAEWSDLDAFVSPDGRRLFFISTRPKPGSDPLAAKRDMDLWVAERHGDGWAAPQWIENVNSEAKEGAPSVARDGSLYFFSNRGAEADSNSIYASHLVNGKYAPPEKLPAEINAGPSDTSPCISPDGKTLLFYSMRAGGHGQADLYVSHLKHGRWSAAMNLGAVVNTAEFEYNPSVSPDGKQFFFGRGRAIYAVPTHAVKALRAKDFVR